MKDCEKGHSKISPTSLSSALNFYSPYQFAFFRIIFGLYLIVHFLLLISRSHELSEVIALIPIAKFLPMRAFLVFLSLLSLLLTFGLWRRVTALILFLASCCLLDRNFFGSTLTLPCVEFILLVMAIAPAGEALALDPKSPSEQPWEMPRWLYKSAWIFLALCYGLSALYQLQNPSWLLLTQPFIFIKILNWCYRAFELSFIIFCIFNKTRKWAWIIMTSIQLVILLTGIHVGVTLGLLMLHLFVFDARWLKARAFKDNPIVFFDGYCGLCDWFVSFVISEDKNHVLRFAPLQGERAKLIISAHEIEKLKSVILYDNQKLYRQSDAILRTLSYLGGLWRLLELGVYLPRGIRDRLYDYIAEHRYKWFGQHELCKIPTPEERRFFLP